MNQQPSQPHKQFSRLHSIGYALQGLVTAFRQEPNMRIHALATIVVVAAGFIKGLAAWQWLAICGCIGGVWIAELFNTAIERLSDVVCEGQYHPVIKLVKDISAAAVLCAALTNIVIGAIVFFN